MNKSKSSAILSLVVVVLLLAACGGAAVVGVEQSGEGAVGPQEIAGATEVVRFDPVSILPEGDPVSGACAESAIVAGAYRCDLGAGGAAEPCFALGGTRLICDPDPVTGSYAAFVSPTHTLPSIIPPPPDKAVPFFVELNDGLTCAIRTAPEPVIIGGVSALYDCGTPYTYIVGFEKSAPTWEAGVFTLDPTTGGSPSGKVPANVRRAWIP